MRRVCVTTYLLSSVLCLAPLLGPATPLLFAENTALNQTASSSPEMEAWRLKMMGPRGKKAGCYVATYPDTQWSAVPCGTPDGKTAATEATTAKVTTSPHPMALPNDESSEGDYVAVSSGLISSATGTLTIANNDYAD